MSDYYGKDKPLCAACAKLLRSAGYTVKDMPESENNKKGICAQCRKKRIVTATLSRSRVNEVNHDS